MEKIVILDGNSLLNRAYYAIPLLVTKNGVPTNAIYGFSNMLYKINNDIKPDHIIATFDKSGKTFRHKKFEEYKAGRKKMPEELAAQFSNTKKMLNLMGISIYELEGYEADDVIGTLAKFLEKNNIEVYILTGDRDALQLASKTTKVILTKKGVTETEIYDLDKMIEEKGVTPKEFIEVKGLMGDPSDNIPGVKGVGEKTAYKLIKEFGSIEEVLKNIDKINGKKLKENLTLYKDDAILSKWLAEIDVNAPITLDLDSIKNGEKFKSQELKKFFIELEMKSIASKFIKEEEVFEKQSVEYKKICSLKEFRDLKNDIKDELFIYFNLKDEELFSKISIQSIYISCEDKNYCIDFSNIIKDDKVFSLFQEILEDEKIKKISHDVKNALTCLKKLGINLKNLVFDTAIGAYLLDSSKGKYTLESLCENYLDKNIKVESEEDKILLCSKLKELYSVLNAKISESEMDRLLHSIEIPLTDVLSEMETNGFKVDREKLDSLKEKFKKEIDKTQKEIFELSEEEFNINSPKQLGKILFEKLDLPVIKKTKTGYSTNAEVLEKLSGKHEIIDKITYFRQLSKIYSTYIEGLIAVIDEDGCIHSSFNQTVTTTGRLSSTEPNLQNIPIKYEMGREIRKVFIPKKEGDLILSADYSQIELRVLAHISSDSNMIDAFLNHSDIHTKTASEVFNVPISGVTSIMRSRAKAVNFGIVYGISDFSLSKDLNITKKEAKEYMDIYFERYPKIKSYLEDVVHDAKSKGYVTTMLNRRRFIPEITAKNKILKSFGERLAMNAPIQGSAADIIKLAMVNVYKELRAKGLKSTLILQVHDELILNVLSEELDLVEEIVKNEMEKVLDISVPLEVDINIGNTWYDAK